MFIFNFILFFKVRIIKEEKIKTNLKKGALLLLLKKRSSNIKK